MKQISSSDIEWGQLCANDTSAYCSSKLSSTSSKKFSLTLPIYVKDHESVQLDPKRHFVYVELI